MVLNNTTDCYSFINSTSRLIVHLSVYGATTSIGAVSCLTAIVLILVAKGYKEFIYRLILYMAVDGLFSCVVTIASVFGNDYNVQHAISKSLNLMMSYMIYIYFFLLCWLGLYLFSLVVFRVQFKKTKHEAIGLVTALVTPWTFLWVFPWKARKSSLCDTTYSLREIELIAFYNIPILFSTLLISILTGAVLITLCKNAAKRAENTMHMRAVKEAMPLVIFVIAHQVSDIINISVLACQVYMSVTNKRTPFFVWELFDLWPLVLLFLPILLLSRPRIRHRINCRRSQRHLNTNTEHAATVHQSSGVTLPSDTHYSVQHEESVSSTCGDTSISHSFIAVSPTVHEKQPLLDKTQIGCSVCPMHRC